MDYDDIALDAWPEPGCDCDGTRAHGVQACRPGELDLFVVCAECGARKAISVDAETLEPIHAGDHAGD
jgi:hypothetical protein